MNPRVWLFLCLFAFAGLAQGASLFGLEFENEAQRDRYMNLIAELRCLVCQNQSLADSDADLAQDLRQETYRLLLEGKSDQEIIDFLVQRYGNFVLYNPPLTSSTALIWFGPFVLFLLAAGFLVYTLRKRSSGVATDGVDQNQVARAASLLNDNHDDKPAGNRPS